MSTTIEWTHPPGYAGDTWNPVVGCSRKSTGCEHCYAELMASRIANSALALLREKCPVAPEGTRISVLEAAQEFMTPTQVAYLQAVRWESGGYDGPKYFTDKALPLWSRKLIPLPHKLDYPLKIKRPTCFFLNSMSDLFHERVPEAFIRQVLAVATLCPQHYFLILTKRPEVMARVLNDPSTIDEIVREANAITDKLIRPLEDWLYHHIDELGGWPLKNVGFGTSMEDQRTADERLPELLRCPAGMHFVSCEPLLGGIDLRHIKYPAGPEFKTHIDSLKGYLQGGSRWQNGAEHVGIHWVIVGGESGPGARPFVLGHAKEIVRQCQAADVPVFVKQLGAQPVNREGVPHPTKSKKGNDPAEWPAVLRVQQWPKAITEHNAVPA